jgi:hypothetical protein
MTRANAKIEQATRGQIGHPAACMIENNARLRTNKYSGLWLMHKTLCQGVGSMILVVQDRKSNEHGAQKLWITLWATMVAKVAKPRQA